MKRVDMVITQNLKRLWDRRQLPPSELPSRCGPLNVGKSSMINKLFNQTSRAFRRAGKTVNFFRADGALPSVDGYAGFQR
ncbi:MAG: GTPase [Anaerotruncus colihominis]